MSQIGTTRWRSKSDAIYQLFGYYNTWAEYEDVQANQVTNNLKYMKLVVSLSIIANFTDFSPKTRNEANSLLQKFLSFETILTAMMCLLIFKITTPLSDYLQTRNLDYAQTWNLVSTAQENLRNPRNQFHQTLSAAQNFAKAMTEVLDEKIEGNPSLETYNLSIESELPTKRQRKRNKMPHETADDKDSLLKMLKIIYRQVFNVVIDQINQSMATRFSDQKRL